MKAVLRGREHTRLDAVEVVADADAAIALTRGRHPKRYGFTDPNEDVVAVERRPGGTLLIVADGHGGWQGAEVAVTALLDVLDPIATPADLSDADLVAAFHAVNEQVLEVQRQTGLRTRTTLAMALVASGSARIASFGDSLAAVVAGSEAAVLTRPRMRFLGYAMSQPEIAGPLARRHVEVPAGGWIVAVTDGLSEFVGLEAVPAELAAAAAGAAGPEDLVRAVIDRAGRAGAGDNVAVAAVRG